MNAKELAQRIDAQLYPGGEPGDTEVERIYAADTMSDLIAHAAPDTLLVTSLCNNQLIRVAELMDVPAVCLVKGGCQPGAELLTRARATGTAILVSKVGLQETCALLSSVLGDPRVTRA